jgi:tetratricopeptide (TPR) repeat protein
MRSRGLFFVLFLSVAFFSGCESRRTAALLDDIQSYLQDRPDSALAALQAISQEPLSSSRLRARYSLLNAMALHKSYIDTADLSVIEPADRYYSRHGSALEKMKTLHQKGIIQMNGSNYQDAVISLSEAEKYIDQTEDWFNGGLICISLCKLYNKLHDTNEELSYAIKAEGHFEKVDKPVYYYDARIKHAIALSNLGKCQKAVDIYRDILKIEDLDSSTKYSAMVHLAHTQMYRQYINPVEADSLFTIVLNETGKLPYRNNWGAYALASELVGNRKRADRIYAQLDTTDKETFVWYSRSLYARREYQNAFDHLELSIASQKEMLNVALTQAAHKAQRDYSEALRRDAEHKVFRQRVFIVAGLVFALLIGLVAYLVIRHRLEKNREENARLLEVASALSKQLQTTESERERQLADIRQRYIRMYQSSFKEIGEIYESLVIAGRRDNPQPYVMRQVKRITSDIENNDKSGSRLEQMIDGAMDGLMRQFRQDYPNLREPDYKLMSFIIAGFDMPTLSIFFNQKSSSVPYTRKHRLKTKIQEASPEISSRYLPFF